MLRVYTYAKCDTCRRAVKFLRARDIAFIEIPIRETPPTKTELQAMLTAQNGEIRKLFNTSGGDYKALGLSSRLPALPVDEALSLLAHGRVPIEPCPELRAHIAPGGLGRIERLVLENLLENIAHGSNLCSATNVRKGLGLARSRKYRNSRTYDTEYDAPQQRSRGFDSEIFRCGQYGRWASAMYG